MTSRRQRAAREAQRAQARYPNRKVEITVDASGFVAACEKATEAIEAFAGVAALGKFAAAAKDLPVGRMAATQRVAADLHSKHPELTPGQCKRLAWEATGRYF